MASSPLVEKVAAFIKQHVRGNELQMSLGNERTTQVYQGFREAGLANWWMPREFGGHHATLEESVEVVNEIAYGDGGLAAALFIPILSSTPLVYFGTEAQKQKYLKTLTASGAMSAMLASETEAGSELLRVNASAERAGAGYTLNASKFMSADAGQAQYIVCLARVKPADSPPFRLFIFPANASGVSVGRRWPLAGLDAAGVYQVNLSNVTVPEEDVLQVHGIRGLEVGLNASRVLICASAVGIARRIRDLCMDYAKNKSLQGGVLMDHPVFAAKMGQIEVHIDTMNALCRSAAREYDEIVRSPNCAQTFMQKGMLKSVGVAKVMCGQLGWQVASVGSEMFGGLGYSNDFLMPKLMRDMRYVSIVEAGEDVLREFIFRNHVRPHYG